MECIFVFIRKEHYGAQQKHTVSPVADVPSRVISLGRHTSVLRIRKEKERVSRDLFVEAPSPLSAFASKVYMKPETGRDKEEQVPDSDSASVEAAADSKSNLIGRRRAPTNLHI